MMLKNALYMCITTLVSVVFLSNIALAKPVINLVQNYSQKLLTPVRDSSRFDRGNWTNIGCQRADYVEDRYVMDVERDKGPFDKLRLKISSVDFHVVGIRVVFYNGERASLVIRSEDSYPGRGVILSLPGKRRYIKKIIMKYGHRRSSFRPIVVCIDGHEVEERGYSDPYPSSTPYPRDSGSDNYGDEDDRDDDYDSGGNYGSEPEVGNGSWKNLGCIKAKYRTKSRYFHIGRDKGRFKALRLKAGKHSVRIKSLSVTFGNGRKKHIPIKRFLKRRSNSEVLYLNNRRFIKVVDIRLKTSGLFRKSTICLQGLAQSDGGGSYGSRPWRSYGCKAFRNFNPRSKFISLGRKSGRLKELRLTVSGSAFLINNLGVVYGNGRSKVLVRSRTRVRRGTSSRSYRFGGKRYIQEVEIVGSKQGRHGRASTVCVEAR